MRRNSYSSTIAFKRKNTTMPSNKGYCEYTSVPRVFHRTTQHTQAEHKKLTYMSLRRDELINRDWSHNEANHPTSAPMQRGHGQPQSCLTPNNALRLTHTRWLPRRQQSTPPRRRRWLGSNPVTGLSSTPAIQKTVPPRPVSPFL